jgi:hypothetical protein
VYLLQSSCTIYMHYCVFVFAKRRGTDPTRSPSYPRLKDEADVEYVTNRAGAIRIDRGDEKQWFTRWRHALVTLSSSDKRKVDGNSVGGRLYADCRPCKSPHCLPCIPCRWQTSCWRLCRPCERGLSYAIWLVTVPGVSGCSLPQQTPSSVTSG